MTAAARISVRATALAAVLGLVALSATLSPVPATAAPARPRAAAAPAAGSDAARWEFAARQVAPSGSGSPVPASPGSRTGGSPGAPAPGKPGWVWWAGAALVVILGAGGFRLWRNRDIAADDPGEPGTDPETDPADNPDEVAV